MLTLNEIRNVNFRKANFGGYRAEDVEAFIDEVQLSYDTLLRENAELVKKLEVLAAKLEEYQSEEDSIRNALMNAQKVGDASLRDAKHKAEIILKDATIKAEKIVANAQAEIHSERDIIERMQRDIAEFKTKLLRAYKEHLTLINNIPNEEVMRPETREMVDAVQMLDRRATEPSYDRPPQQMPNARTPRSAMEREMGEMPDGQGVPNMAPECEGAMGGDAVVREDARREQSRPMQRPEAPRLDREVVAAAESVSPQRSQMAQPVMPVERSAQRKGGFTVDIAGDSMGSVPPPQPAQSAPAPAAPAQRRPSRFNTSFDDDIDVSADRAQFSSVKVPEQPQEQGGFSPASLFKRRGAKPE